MQHNDLHDLLVNVFFLVSRYIHIVCTTLLVGGTLFYEMVVPIAIGDLREEVQLGVFARARWVFRRIVWIASILLVLSGIGSTAFHWENYVSAEDPEITVIHRPMNSIGHTPMRPGWWWAAHASTGVLAVLIALSLTWGATPPARPLAWMRLNLVILAIVIFLASTTRHVRIMLREPAGDVMIPFVAAR